MHTVNLYGRYDVLVASGRLADLPHGVVPEVVTWGARTFLILRDPQGREVHDCDGVRYREVFAAELTVVDLPAVVS